MSGYFSLDFSGTPFPLSVTYHHLDAVGVVTGGGASGNRLIVCLEKTTVVFVWKTPLQAVFYGFGQWRNQYDSSLEPLRLEWRTHSSNFERFGKLAPEAKSQHYLRHCQDSGHLYRMLQLWLKAMRLSVELLCCLQFVALDIMYFGEKDGVWLVAVN